MPLKNQGVFRTPMQEHPPGASLGHPADDASMSKVNQKWVIRRYRLEVHAVAVLEQLSYANSVLQIAQLINRILVQGRGCADMSDVVSEGHPCRKSHATMHTCRNSMLGITGCERFQWSCAAAMANRQVFPVCS